MRVSLTLGSAILCSFCSVAFAQNTHITGPEAERLFESGKPAGEEIQTRDNNFVGEIHFPYQVSEVGPLNCYKLEVDKWSALDQMKYGFISAIPAIAAYYCAPADEDQSSP